MKMVHVIFLVPLVTFHFPPELSFSKVLELFPEKKYKSLIENNSFLEYEKML